MGQPHAYLGDIPMDLPAYMDRMDVVLQVDWAEHQKAGQKPRLQWVGDKLDEVQLTARLHAAICTPEVELAKLRDATRKHEAMQLFFTNGHIVGWFVITAMEQRSEQLMRDGTVIVAEVSLSLREYTEDGLSTEVAASGTPVAALKAGGSAGGAGGGSSGASSSAASAPAGTVTVEPDARQYGRAVVRGGSAITTDDQSQVLVSYDWLEGGP